ncbi:hypothetical protein ABFT23_20420 [Nocardioides sp. C4-1]|uniref:TadE/TadG family type IV pilus assembly protein n=1 Tax=Nocardioides sp. C4-1 TaxID=3151851 RepID=UPI003266AB7B
MPPELHHVYLMLTGFQARLRHEQRGATAVEWVIITAVLIALATGIGVAITAVVKGKADSIKID